MRLESRETVLRLMERLADVGLGFTLGTWKMNDGNMAYSIRVSQFTIPAEDAERVIAIAREFGLRAWFSHDGVSLEAAAPKGLA